MTDIVGDIRAALFGSPPTPNFQPDPTALLAALTEIVAALAVNAVGGQPKAQCAFCPTANVNLASALVNGATFDGYTCATGDRALLINQTDATQNGIYVVAASGAASRSSDANTSLSIASMSAYVANGTTNGKKIFALTTQSPTLGTTALSFVQYQDIGALMTAIINPSVTAAAASATAASGSATGAAASAAAAAASQASMATRYKIKPGPSRFVKVDPNGYMLEFLSSSVFSNPVFNALVTQVNAIKGAVLGITKIKPGPSSVRRVDQNGYALSIEDKISYRSSYLNTVASNALAGAASAKPRARRRCVSRHGGLCVQTVGQSSGGASVTGGTDRLGFVLNTDCTALEFIFVNSIVTSGFGIQPNGNFIQFTSTFDLAPQNLHINFANAQAAQIQQADGTTASGAQIAHVAPDQSIMHSLPLMCGGLNSGTTQYYRFHKKVSTGQKWPFTTGSGRHDWVGGTTSDPVYGTTVTTGIDGTYYGGYSASLGNYASTAYACGVALIIGQQLTEIPVVMVCGDSISDLNGGFNWQQKTLENAGVQYWSAGIGGSTMSSQASYSEAHGYCAQFFDYVWSNIGTNDLTVGGVTLATLKANMVKYIQAHSNKENKFALSTILPRVNNRISSVTCGGTTTATFTIDGGWLPASGTFTTTISGFTTSGYNGTFTATVVSPTSFSVSIGSVLADETGSSSKVYTTANFLSDVAGQVPNSVIEPSRLAWNNFIRDTTATGAVAYFSGIFGSGRILQQTFDPCLPIEKNSDGSALSLTTIGGIPNQQATGTGGRWPANGTPNYASNDGTHNNTAIRDIIAAALSSQAASAFVLF